MKRREFIKQSFQVAGAVSLTSFPYHLFAGETKKYASDLVTLGNTAIKTSHMAMGTGSWCWGGSSNQTRKLGIIKWATILLMPLLLDRIVLSSLMI